MFQSYQLLSIRWAIIGTIACICTTDGVAFAQRTANSVLPNNDRSASDRSGVDRSALDRLASTQLTSTVAATEASSS